MINQNNKTIWKYPIEIARVQKLAVPAGSQILKLDKDPVGQYCIWVLFDKDNKDNLVTWNFELFGTGWDVSSYYTEEDYVGMIHEGPYIWHLFKY